MHNLPVSKSLKKIFLTLSLLAGIAYFTASPTLAQQSNSPVSLTVSPPRHELEIDPGEKVQETVKITNNSLIPVAVSITVEDYIVQDDAGTPLKVSVEEAGKYVASPWFILDKTVLNLAPQQSETVTVLINTPQDALPGGHYAAIYFQPLLGSAPESSGPQVASQIGSLFAITVSGDINYDALIRDFKAEQRLYEFGPVDFSAILDNQSDTHISPTPTIEIKNMIGRKVEILELDSVNVFPFTERKVASTWDTTWGFGRYEATMNVPYGMGLLATSTIFFWILPYRLIAAILVIILVLIVIIISVRRHNLHKRDSRDEEIDTLKRKIVELENKK